MKDKKKVVVQSVGRAIEILQCFEAHDELGVTEISRIMNLHKSTTYGLISTLESYRFLERNQETGKYRLGLEIFRLGTKINADLRNIVTPYLEKLVNEYEETVHLVIRDNCDVLYLHKIESPHSMRICSRVGERLPLYCTGVGKSILSYLDKVELDEILDKFDYKKLTKFTIVDKHLLKKHLEETRLRGYAEDIEELELGLNCIAAPIFNHIGKPIAAISVAGPSTRMTKEIRSKIAQTLIKYTQEVSKKMGY